MMLRVTNIQHFCLHDGSGIRTTIFLKGCNLTCPWCCNPENMNFDIENDWGYDISVNDLEKEILKDKSFYSTGGGVTFSGGEPLLQIKKLIPLLQRLKSQNINICMETSLSVSNDLVSIAMEFIDELFVDIKILDEVTAKNVLNLDVNLYFKNLESISISNVTFRVPLCEEYTLNEENVSKLLFIISKYPNFKVELFKVHNLAESKYDSCNLNFKKFDEVSDEKIEKLLKRIKKINNDVKIIEI